MFAAVVARAGSLHPVRREVALFVDQGVQRVVVCQSLSFCLGSCRDRTDACAFLNSIRLPGVRAGGHCPGHPRFYVNGPNTSLWNAWRGCANGSWPVWTYAWQKPVQLLALTPAPGWGRRQNQAEADLVAAGTAILHRYGVADLLIYSFERQETHCVNYAGRGRGGVDRPQ